MGLTYDLSGKGTTILGASYGRYYDKVPTYGPGTYAGTGFTPITYYGAFNTGPAFAPQDFQAIYDFAVQPQNITTIFDSQALPVADGTKGPHSDLISGRVEHQFGPSFAVSLSYLYRYTKDYVTLTQLGNPDTYTPFQYTSPFTGQTITYYSITPPSRRTFGIGNMDFWYQRGNELILEMRSHPTPRAFVNASVTWEHTTGTRDNNECGVLSLCTNGVDQDPNFFNNPFYTQGVLSQSRPFNFKILGSYQLPWNITTSADFRWFAGRHYGAIAYTYQLDDRGRLFQRPVRFGGHARAQGHAHGAELGSSEPARAEGFPDRDQHDGVADRGRPERARTPRSTSTRTFRTTSTNCTRSSRRSAVSQSAHSASRTPSRIRDRRASASGWCSSSDTRRAPGPAASRGRAPRFGESSCSSSDARLPRRRWLSGRLVCALASDQGIQVGRNVQVSRAHDRIAHNEVLLAADPADPGRLLGCSMAFDPQRNKTYTIVYASSDGGESWSPTLETVRPRLQRRSGVRARPEPARLLHGARLGGGREGRRSDLSLRRLGSDVERAASSPLLPRPRPRIPVGRQHGRQVRRPRLRARDRMGAAARGQAPGGRHQPLRLAGRRRLVPRSRQAHVRREALRPRSRKQRRPLGRHRRHDLRRGQPLLGRGGRGGRRPAEHAREGQRHARGPDVDRRRRVARDRFHA